MYSQLDVQHNISVNTIKQGQQFLKHLHVIIVSGYFDQIILQCAIFYGFN